MNVEIQAALNVADETDSFLQITDIIYDKEAEQGYSSLNNAEQTIFLVDQFLKEMENGGFCVFIRHETGALCEQTLAALERIKAKKAQALLANVLSLFKKPLSTDEDERAEQLESVQSDYYDELNELDEQYYEEDENLIFLTLKYVTEHIKEF